MNRRLPGTLRSCRRLLVAPTLTRSLSTTHKLFERQECQVLVVGGGTGGCAMAAKLSSRLGSNKVIVLEPEEKHYYQPMFTLIGGGMKRLDQSHRQMGDVLPKKAKWIQESALNFDPDKNEVSTSGGKTIAYDFLVIATGMQLKYEKAIQALEAPKTNVCSIYSPKYVDNVYDCLRKTYRGNVIFTFPHCPIKCAGAPQKIAYIAEHYFRKMGRRDQLNIIYNTSLPVIFGVKQYADALWKVAKKRNINVNVNRNLVEVRPEDSIAVFEDLAEPGKLYEEVYSMLHVCPPMTAPDVIANCKQLATESGFVDVDAATLQHKKYSNVFAIGDSACTPNSKTAAAAAAQSPVVFKNLMAVIEGKKLTEAYDGYASCPLVTGYSTCILAEFDYSLAPLETFPFDQAKERYTMFIMKKTFMPILYWQLMMRGYWNGPATMRKVLSILKLKK
ncbi:hypothetical protein KR059_001093 [Drosophila kikkawai]|nr:hypothetical protein KR059_001093 [Drosophila kikkawai]